MIKIWSWIGAILAIFTMGMIIYFLIESSLPAFLQINTGLFDIDGQWRPLSANPSFNILPMTFATLYVAFLGVAIAFPFAVGCAMFLNFYARKKTAAFFLSFIDMLAGLPSVIFGFLGLVLLVKSFESHLQMTTGECVLAAGILLAVMLLPYIVSSSYESIQKAEKRFMYTSLAMGISKEYSMIRIILPAIRKSILTSVMLSFGRALGETMAVMMVIGNSPIYPRLFGRAETIPALTALEMGSVEYGSLHLSSLYAANVVLLFILFIVLGIGYLFQRKLKKYDEI
jgi:phosphate transport system permease protein